MLRIFFKVASDSEITLYCDPSENQDAIKAVGQLAFCLGHLLPLDVDLYVDFITDEEETEDLLPLDLVLAEESENTPFGERTNAWYQVLKPIVKYFFLVSGREDLNIVLEETIDDLAR